MSLTQQQSEAFKTDGFLTGITVLSPEEVRQNRGYFDELESKVGREKCQVGLLDPHFTERFVWDLATYPQILDCMQSLLGFNLLLMATHFFCKYGPSEAFVSWHQDVTYWELEPPMAVSAWIAIDDSDYANGCMQVIPGLHQRGLLEHGKAKAAGNLLSINQELPLSEQDLRRAVNLELKAGQISIHHGMIPHGSQPNGSSRRRCGLAMVYMPTCVRPAQNSLQGEKWHPVLVRGENREGHFDCRPHPFPPI